MSTSAQSLAAAPALHDGAAPLAQRLFVALCDGHFHSGSELARAAGVTRSAVWKAMRQLRAMGAQVHAVTHRGYRLAAPAAVLDVRHITDLLGDATQDVLVDVAWSLESTNLALLNTTAVAGARVQVLLAEHQSAGRGRRGRRWLAPLGGGLCLSLATSFAELPPDVSALSLAMGVCVLRAMQQLDLAPAQLKWPNDMVTSAGKLGGILIELRAESGGPAHVVVGIGLNMQLDDATRGQLDAAGNPATDLRALGADPQDRNAVAAALIAQCARGLREFGRHGFGPFIDEWRAADALRDRSVQISGDATESEAAAHLSIAAVGIARGIDARGALLLEGATGLRAIVAGEVSVRAGA